MPYELDATADLVQDQGFDSVSEFKSVKRTATEKIADAIWIYELIKAYKHPDTTPGNCDECGEPAGYPHTKTDRKDESIILCMNCSDIDPDSPPHSNYPYTPISDNEE